LCSRGTFSERTWIPSSVYPACYRPAEYYFQFAALDNNGELASYSNYGNKVHIAAPGAIYCAHFLDNKYGYLSGTSMAAPFVTGVAALLKSKDPIISVAEIKSRILNNATKMQNLSEIVYTREDLMLMQHF
jgi:subtilisin family serine protease